MFPSTGLLSLLCLRALPFPASALIDANGLEENYMQIRASLFHKSNQDFFFLLLPSYDCVNLRYYVCWAASQQPKRREAGRQQWDDCELEAAEGDLSETRQPHSRPLGLSLEDLRRELASREFKWNE